MPSTSGQHNLMMFTTLSLLSYLSIAPFAFAYVQYPNQLQPQADVKVPVILGVMSRCPDALLCESVFDDVLKRVEDKVDLKLSFIAR